MYKLLQIIISIVIININKCESIRVIYYNNIERGISIKFHLGTPGLIKYFYLDLVSNSSWGSNLIAFEKSSTINSISNSTVIINNQTYSSVLKKDKLSLSTNDKKEIILKDFFFHSLINSSFDVYDSISFSRHPNKSNFSLLYLLLNNHYITKKIFGFVKDKTTYMNGLMYIGDKIDSLPEPIASCKLLDRNEWGCSVYQMKLNFTSYSFLETFGIFRTDLPLIYIPEKAYNFYYLKVLKNLINKNICKYSIDNKQELRCKCEAKDKLDTFTFGFDFLNEITLTGKELLIKGFKDCRLLIEKNNFKYPDNENTIIFGSYFIQNFSPMFNEEDKNILFYNLSGIDIDKNNYKKPLTKVSTQKIIRNLLLIEMFITSLMIFVLQITKKK